MPQIDCVQYSEEWWGLHTIPTASQFKRIVTSKGERSKQRKAYLHECANARITGIHKEGYQSAAMQEGHDREELSRMIYAMEKECVVDEVGFWMSDCGRWGASPDGLIGDDGLLELKNPNGGTLIGWSLDGKLPMEHIQQVQGELFVTGREWADFCSYSPKLPLFILRVYRDDIFCDKLEAELVTFCEELDEICEKIKGGS